MLDTFAKAGPLIVSAVGVMIAFMVYRLNSEKLFLDMLAARRDAVREILDAAEGREREADRISIRTLEESGASLPEQARYWRAQNTASGLFGREVGRNLAALDNALGDIVVAKLNIRDPSNLLPMPQAEWERVEKALRELDRARSAFVIATRPYINLGRRGLPIADRARLLIRRD